jgi:hypothetical protein
MINLRAGAFIVANILKTIDICPFYYDNNDSGRIPVISSVAFFMAKTREPTTSG